MIYCQAVVLYCISLMWMFSITVQTKKRVHYKLYKYWKTCHEKFAYNIAEIFLIIQSNLRNIYNNKKGTFNKRCVRIYKKC